MFADISHERQQSLLRQRNLFALTSAGLGMGSIQGVAKELIGFAKAKVGSATVDEVVGSIPGLSQFV